MAKIRSIHPELCTDETLADVSARAERTFVRLLPHLDDAGRSVDNPKLLKAQLYPLHEDVTSADVDQELTELASAGLILRYTNAGRRFLSAKPTAWERWQKPRWRYPSKLPAPADTKPPDVQCPSDVHPTDIREVPDDVGPTSDRAGVGVGVGEVVGVGEEAAAAAAARPTPDRLTSDVRPTPLTADQRQQRLAAAIEILVQRHIQANPSRNPTRHIPAIRNGKLTDHHHAGNQLLFDHPALTDTELADLLEPATAPSPPKPEPVHCDTCDDRGLVESPGGWRYCPTCSPRQAERQRRELEQRAAANA